MRGSRQGGYAWLRMRHPLESAPSTVAAGCADAIGANTSVERMTGMIRAGLASTANLHAQHSA
jgi:hypothetical protein